MKDSQPATSKMWKTILTWCALSAISVSLSLYLDYHHVPAAYLLGALSCSIVFAVCNLGIRIPKPLFFGGQGILGAMIASTIPVTVFSQLAQHWLLFISGICSVLILTNLLGLFMAQRQILPGSTAIWGTSPGAATAMTLMAESFGADVRLVAFMQYLRVIVVTLVAIIITHLCAPDLPASSAQHAHMISWHVASWSDFSRTLILVVICVSIGVFFHIPAGPMLVTLGLGIVLNETGLITLTIPQPLLLLSYMLVGWNIGFRFNREVLRYAFKAMPKLLLSIFTIIAACGVLSQLLVLILGIDPLTAYLAMSPGGADSVAIIAASGHADMSLVMAMQTGRLILVILCGPPMARWMASRQAKTMHNQQHPQHG